MLVRALQEHHSWLDFAKSGRSIATMNLLNYQRTIFGYHGCDRAVADPVLTGRQQLGPSSNEYDWLGSGIYFWEHGPSRALEWAENWPTLDP